MSSAFAPEDGWKSAGIRADMLAEVRTGVILDHCRVVTRAREAKNQPRSRAFSNSAAADGPMGWHAWTDGPVSRLSPVSRQDSARASAVAIPAGRQ
jgi:hypothetical protein